MGNRPACPASRALTVPCQHPDGDYHGGLCFNDDHGEREEWDRNVSWFCDPMSPVERRSHRDAGPNIRREAKRG